MSLFFLPLGAHAVLMLVDEFFYHNQRGLSRWERWGHPMDTLTVLIPTATLLFAPLSPPDLAAAYIGMAAFSSLFVTKDEWVHSRECTAGEQWIHSVLFVLHPVFFWCIWNMAHAGLRGAVQILFASQVLFFTYQIARWNLWTNKTV